MIRFGLTVKQTDLGSVALGRSFVLRSWRNPINHTFSRGLNIYIFLERCNKSSLKFTEKTPSRLCLCCFCCGGCVNVGGFVWGEFISTDAHVCSCTISVNKAWSNVWTVSECRSSVPHARVCVCVCVCVCVYVCVYVCVCVCVCVCVANDLFRWT